jgi:hypothetical protein
VNALFFTLVSVLGYLGVGMVFAPFAYWRTVNHQYKENRAESKARSEALGNAIAVSLTWPVTVPIWSYCILFKSVIDHTPDPYKLDKAKQGRIVDPAYVKALESEVLVERYDG